MNKTSADVNGAGSVVNRVTLVQMQTGQRGRIVEIEGGHGLACKLDALGIRVGEELTKISAQWVRGPVIVRQGNTQAALGFGMASRVLVELRSKSEK